MLELLQAPHALRERGGDSGLGEIAVLGELRHLEVGADQEEDGLRRALVERQAAHDAAPDAHAALDVALALALADVVQEHPQVEGRRVVDLVEQPPQADQRGVAAAGHLVQRVHRAQRVLVHGVAVEHVVLDQVGDAGELRYQAAEHARLVQRAQRRSHPPAPAQHAQQQLARLRGRAERPVRLLVRAHGERELRGHGLVLVLGLHQRLQEALGPAARRGWRRPKPLRGRASGGGGRARGARAPGQARGRGAGTRGRTRGSPPRGCSTRA